MAIGNFALQKVAAGSGGWNGADNTAVGLAAGANITTGFSNSLFSENAGNSLTTGGANVLIGYSSGYGITTGNNNIIIGDNVDAPSGTGSQQLNTGNVLYGTGIYNGTSGTLSSSPIAGGKIGIGTTSPLAKLDVAGTNNATVPLFQLSSVASFATTTEFIVNNNGNATLAGCLNYNGGTSGTCLSDERVKQDINPFTDGLQEIIALNPVTYQYNGLAGTPNDGDVRTGLIAQQVQLVAPDLVSTTSAMLNPTDITPTQLLEVNYSALTFALINAVKEIASISGSFESTLIAWLGNASNGITQFFADTITANKQPCVKNSAGTPICLTGDQLAALLAAENQSPSAAQPSPAGGANPPESVTQNSASSTPPTITINGANPAIIQVGDSYADLGASVTDTVSGQAGDTNLGLKYFLNGTLVSNIVLDTSAVATDTIDYVATDTYGNTATSTRMIIVEVAPSTDATTSAATSTTQ